MSYFDEYRITSPFGWRTSPFGGGREYHTGVDLVKSHQSPIYAFVSGEVTHAKEGVPGSGFGGYGIVVAIKDKYDCLHVYAHLDSVAVKVGQKVSKGQMIGRQGTTGQSTGSHLHYEVRKTSSPQYGWIADRPNNCYEPSTYLISYYTKEQEKMKNEVSSWAKSSQRWAKDNGISDGERPKDGLTREEQWVMLRSFENYLAKKYGLKAVGK